MNGYEVYCLYTALKLHFSSNYDYFKYNGKVKSTTPEAYERRKDKYMFHKLARKIPDRDMINYLVANFIKNDSYWTKDLIGEDAQANFREWQKRNQALPYYYRQDLAKINTEAAIDGGLNEVFLPRNGNLPTVLILYLNNQICIETIVILNKIINLFGKWQGKIMDDVIYPKIVTKILKYEPFVEVNTERAKEIAKSVLTEA